MTLIAVAAALLDSEGRVLIQRRPDHKQHGGLWEFPGGKCDPGETVRAALVRELAEELAIEVALADLHPAAFAAEPHPSGELLLLLFICRRWTGTPVALAASALAWVVPEALAAAPADWPTPPADVRLVAMLPGLIAAVG